LNHVRCVLNLHACMHDARRPEGSGALGPAGPSPGAEKGTEERSMALYKICKRENRHLTRSLCVSKAAWRCTPSRSLVALLFTLTFLFLFLFPWLALLAWCTSSTWGLVHVVLTCMRRHGSPTVSRTSAPYACEIQAIHVWICFL
jgi:hypothetical protein